MLANFENPCLFVFHVTLPVIRSPTHTTPLAHIEEDSLGLRGLENLEGA